MNLAQIKSAIEAGQIVHLQNPAYAVVQFPNGEYRVVHSHNTPSQTSVSLINALSGDLLHGESQYYIREPECEGLQCHISQNVNGAYRFDISHVTKGFVTTVISPSVKELNQYYEMLVGYKPMDDYPAMTESDLVVMVAGAILFDCVGVK